MRITVNAARPVLLAALALATGVFAGCGGDDGGATGGSAAALKPSSDPAQIDAAFVRQMVPHHALAVSMAAVAKRRAEHPELQRLAAEITRTQSAELSDLLAVAQHQQAMAKAKRSDGGQTSAGRSDTLRGPGAASDARTLGLRSSQMGMSMGTADLERANPFDEAFITQMTAHHEGAIAMAQVELDHGRATSLRRIAKAIVTGQRKEITEMSRWQDDWYGSR